MAPYDLHQLVYGFAIILAIGAIYVGVLMVRSGSTGQRPISLSGQDGVLGGVLAAFGAILIVLVVMATLGPWREAPPRAFPVHIIDLQAPISRAERDALKQPGP